MTNETLLYTESVRLYPVMTAVDKLHQVVTLYPETLKCQELARVANLLEAIYDILWGGMNTGYPLHQEKLKEIEVLFRNTPWRAEKGETRDINRFVRLTSLYLGHYLTCREDDSLPFTIYIAASSILNGRLAGMVGSIVELD